MTNTAEKLPDDVVEAAAAALSVSLDWARRDLAALLDAGIVALVPEPCETCEGYGDVDTGGQEPWDSKTCPTCDGTGKKTIGGPESMSGTVPCDECDGTGERSADSQPHDHDDCEECVRLYAEAISIGRDGERLRPTPPSAADLPGDGWVRYRVSTDGARVQIHAYNDAWWEMNASPMALNVHPDPVPEFAPRPTDGWEFNIGLYDDDGFWWHEWFWWSLLEETGVEVTSGTERTREKAVQAAEKARAEWDARLGGAS